MATISTKVHDRLVEGLKKFQPIVIAQKAKDIGEADTVMLCTEILSDLFGYDKLTEITAEFAVKYKRCDLATKIDGEIQTVIEVKPIGSELKEQNVAQAVDYSANHGGLGWAVLTNGQHWRAYSVTCDGKVEQELVVDIDLSLLNHKKDDDIALLFLLCKEGWAKSAIEEYKTQRDALNRFVVGATLLSERMLEKIKTELRRVSPNVRIEIEDLRDVLQNEVIKRELVEGPLAEAANKTVAKAAKVVLRETT